MAKVSAIPEGCHTVTPHLICRDCGAAIDFYVKAFGASEVCRMPGPDGKLMHAEVNIGNSRVFLAEEFPQWGALSPQSLNGSPVTIHLYVEDANAAYDKAVAAGCTVGMPLQDMFWGDRYGKVVDPYGHHWSIAQHLEDLTPEQMAERGAVAMAEMAKGCE